MSTYDLRNDLPLLFDFYISAKEGNFSKAANKYFLSPSSLSRNISKLENKLNLKLFVKNNKGITLTLDGEKLYKELDGLFSNLSDNLQKDEKDEISGNITIGTTRNISDYKLEKYLSSFIKKYPNVKIKILTDSASNLNDYLINHRIDILIDYLPHINSSEKYNFEVKTINEFHTCFACSKSFYEDNKNKINSLSDLNNYKLVIPGSSRRRQMLDEILQSNNIVLNPTIEMPDSKLMIDFVNNNDYIGYFIEEELDNTELVKLDLKENMPTNAIGIIYHKKTINNIAKTFVELVVSES